MGPSCRRKTLFKKQHLIKKPENIPAKSVVVLASPVAKSPAKPPLEVAKVDASGNGNSNSNNVCSTPKSKRFRIPEIKTCPPAPKKIRLVTGGGGGGYSLMRRRSSTSSVTAVPYFAPPDIELFFYFALRGIPI